MARTKRIVPVLVILLATALACNMPLGPRIPPADATITAAIKTVEVQLTGSAIAQAMTPTLTATETIEPSDTPVNTRTPRPPTNTSVPPTAVTRCNWAQFVADVSIPDGTRMAPGQNFTKTWRLKNIGTCTWTDEYALAFESGEAMGAPETVQMPEVVPPGDTVDVSVNLKAPATSGRKTGYWKLRNPAGVPFGIGGNAQGTFYVQIDVIKPTGSATVTATATTAPSGTVYDFTANACDAEWRSDAGVLDCPGGDADSQGFVIVVDDPMLENGDTMPKPGLWTHPEWKENGVISGRFPAFDVEAGDRFRATIGCLYDAPACSVRFQLNYRADGGALTPFGQWNQDYNGTLQNLDLDLSPLAGKSVEFVLAVLAGPAADQDWAIWYQPRIVR